MALMAHRLLQGNLNHSARAQDLFVQTLAEWRIGLAIMAEPFHVFGSRSNCLGDTAVSVMIVVSNAANSPLSSPRGGGEGLVVALWGEIVVAGVYSSPNRSLAEFEGLLNRVAVAIRPSLPGPVLVMGDFNAKSAEWSSPKSDARGETLAEWANALGLEVLNRGSEHTCVRQHGGSIVDVSFATPAVSRMVRGWRVKVGVETLSDHRYIRFDVSASTEVTRPRCPRGTPLPSRWTLRRLNKDALMAASVVAAWPEESPLNGRGGEDADEGAVWFRKTMSQICDVGMPRARPAPPRRGVYWWSQEIAELRSACVKARRRYTRCRRRRRGDATTEATLYETYRVAKKSLQRAIAKAKARAWEELLETLERDPWGRPYRIVRNKLRPWAPPVTESLHFRLLEEVITALFPLAEEEAGPPPGRHVEDLSRILIRDEEVPEVTEEELAGAVRKMGVKNTAPGPDGIPGRAWVLALCVLGARLRQLFDLCLRRGRFPLEWKVGRLVLLMKPGRPAESPSAYRPICLLDGGQAL